MEIRVRVSLLRSLYTLLPALGGFVFTFWCIHRSGVGVSPDSIAYVSGAHQLVQTGRLLDYTGHPFVDFPAGYPLLLALLMRLTHADPLNILQYLNPSLFALLIGLCGYMAGRMGYPERWHKPLLAICVALSPALIEVYIMLWSETVFVLLTVLFMIALRRYLYRHSLAALLVVALVCALACFFRYAGVTLVATGGLLLLLERRRHWGHIFLFGFLSVSLLAVNLTRNFLESGTLTGMRQKGVTPLLRNLYYYGDTFSGWFLFGTTHYQLCLIIGLVLLILLVLLFTRGIPRLKGEYPAFVKIGLSFAVVYSVFMVLSATISRYEEINSRLLSALYIPLVLSLSFPLAWFSGRASTRFARRCWRVGGLGILLLVLSSQLVADHQWYADIAEGGIGGYTEDDWDDSPLVKFLEDRPSPFLPGYTLYSNSPEGVYFFGGYSCQLLPQKAFPGPIAQYYATSRQYLIWFNDGTNDAILSLHDVLTHKQMRLVQQFDDGAVYVTAP
ncbi:hypothetical protein [Dinghuibacter silviterrae]|uniref:Dolichyl-phosphate-mannose-protein mannosyltransferase n=1 Tax=Dinghuibacter silviterrae TaxID=1539049 RepID=A0A4R8DI46_9BACT|nr:hypothetical protein [Dinghuibacter silviterrae]TDW97217.1 hypothetical protein EDB95_5062 [Dinghuibacter silviterrae]